jgi:hypothetical protein
MPTTECRITPDNANITVAEMINILTGGNIGAATVLKMWCTVDPMAPLAFLTCIDLKHLYDERIWDVFELCGQDINRFIYHVEMELPDQDTGLPGISGPYVTQIDQEEFFAKRKHGAPGSFWALENPPTDPNYEYPIR